MVEINLICFVAISLPSQVSQSLLQTLCHVELLSLIPQHCSWDLTLSKPPEGSLPVLIAHSFGVSVIIGSGVITRSDLYTSFECHFFLLYNYRLLRYWI